MKRDWAWAKRKLWWVALVSGVGLLVALAFHGEQGWGEGRGYPYNTFLITPIDDFSDFSDETRVALLGDPYGDPLAVYGPFAHVMLLALSPLPGWFALILFFFATCAGLFFLLQKALAGVCPDPGNRVAMALFLLITSYPVIFCFDRGNIEMFLAVGTAATLYFYSRGRYGFAMACLVIAICCKVYPALLLALFVRQRRWLLMCVAAVAVLVISLLSLLPYHTSPLHAWQEYRQNLAYMTDYDIYENHTLNGSATPWNAYKIVLITAAQQHLIPPIDFDFDGPLITGSYKVYCLLALLLAAGLALLTAFVECEWTRGASLLLLFLSMATPTGADYRLLYAGIALALLVSLPTRRRFDLAACILIALALLPKKFFFLEWLGPSEIGFPDISIQVILNPLLVMTAMGLLLYSCLRAADWGWARKRVVRTLQFR